mgnify:CR=1 FL=1
MRGLLSVLIVVVGLYGIGLLQNLEASNELKAQLQETSIVEANMILAVNFEAKQ